MFQYTPYRHKVQYYETDQMGIVHHSNYIRWLEEARCDLMEQAGFSYSEMERRGVIIPVLSVSCKYLHMVHFGDTVTILPKVESFNGVKMTLSYEIQNAATGECCTIADSAHCFLGRDGKPLALKRVQPDIYAFFAGL